MISRYKPIVDGNRNVYQPSRRRKGERWELVVIPSESLWLRPRKMVKPDSIPFSLSPLPLFSLSLSRFLFSPFSFGPLYPLWKSVNETEHTVLVERACRSFYRIASTLIGKLSSCPGSVLFYSSLSLSFSLPSSPPLSPCFSFPGGNQGFIFRDIRYVQTICATSPADS